MLRRIVNSSQEMQMGFYFYYLCFQLLRDRFILIVCLGILNINQGEVGQSTFLYLVYFIQRNWAREISLYFQFDTMARGKRESRQNNKPRTKNPSDLKERFVSEESRDESRTDSPEKKKPKVIQKKPARKLKSESSSESQSSPPSLSQMSAESKLSRSVSRSSNYSNSSDEKQDKEYKRREKGISQLIDVVASQSDGDEESQPNEEQLAKHRQEFLKMQKEMNDKKGEAASFIQKITKMKEEDVNEHYKKKLQELADQEELEDETSKEGDLYQINCNHGKEQELVGWLLNKKRYSLKYPKLFYCTLMSAMAVPKRFPGLVFLEAKSVIEVQKSIRGLKFIRLKTLKKIEYEIFTNLFDPRKDIDFGYHVKQYVRVKIGRYKEDIAQITKVNKKGVIVQIVPRINFADIQDRMRQIEVEYAKINIKDDEIGRAKNERFRQLVDPKGSDRNRADKKKLTPADFQPFTGYSHTKRMKITSDGLLLVSYCFNEIELPKTSFSPHEIIELNRAGDDNYNILKREERNIRMGANLHLNDMVQIIAGELKGCYGRIEQVQTRLVKIKCENKETRGLVLEEISDNVVRLFKEGDSVIVTDGISKGEIGTVFKNGVHCIKILTSNNERLKVNKRDVQLKMFTSIVFDNDLGIKRDDVVKTRLELGIVCDVKKGYVDFVTPKNEIKRAMNYDLSNVTNYRSRVHSREKELLQRDCLVKMLEGRKRDKVLKIKQIYNSYLFLEDPEENHLYGNWVERAEDCSLFLTVPPKIEARFLEDQGMYRKFFQDRAPLPNKKGQIFSPEDDPYRVGKSYLITHGAFRGVKGVITATFKTHIEVLVFNNKLERIDRSILMGKSSRQNKSPVISGDQSPRRGGFMSREIML